MYNNDCYCKGRSICSKPVVALIIALITFVAGIFVGALTDIFTVLGLGAFIAILAILILLLIIQIILTICCLITKHDKCY